VKDGALEFEPIYLPQPLSLDYVMVDDLVKTAIAGHGQYTEQVGTSTNLVY